MKKKNLKKRLGILSLCMLMIVGVSAWLFDHTVQQGNNQITVGETSIQFTNQQNVISLTANNSIPMTQAYAASTLTPYRFKIQNDGDVDLNYTVKIVNFASTFTANKVMVYTGEVADNTVGATIASARSTEIAAANDVDLYTGTVAAGQTTALMPLYAYLDETLELAGYTGHSASFGLVVVGEQVQPAVQP